MVSAEQAAYEQGTLTLDVVLESQALRAEIKMAFLRMGGTLPESPESNARHEEPWTLPPGEMPEPYPKDSRR
jgi:hypothetical protein